MDPLAGPGPAPGEPQPEPAAGAGQGEELGPGQQLAGQATISHQSWFWAKLLSGRFQPAGRARRAVPGQRDRGGQVRDHLARVVPLENLALSPQCGFASTERGNLLTVDEERRKLELVAVTAQQVWG